MSAWDIQYTEDANNDLNNLDSSVKIRVLKIIKRVSQNPLPHSEGGYGKPLGNRSSSKLAGCLKIKMKSDGLRVVYQLLRKNEVMQIIIVSIRDDDKVYKEAEHRLNRK